MKTYLLALTLLLSLATSQADADLIIDVRSKTIVNGMRDFVDVYVSTRQDPNILGMETEQVAGFNYEFSIIGELNSLGQLPGGKLFFRDTFDRNDPAASNANPDSQRSTEQQASDYIFAGLADVNNFTANTENPPSRMNGVDFALNGNFDPVNFTVGQTPLLFARLEVNTSQTPRDAGDLYRIEFTQGNATTFFDAAGNTIPVNFANSNFGPIFVSISAVPEPSSIFMLASALCLAGAIRSRRRRIA